LVVVDVYFGSVVPIDFSYTKPTSRCSKEVSKKKIARTPKDRFCVKQYRRIEPKRIESGKSFPSSSAESWRGDRINLWNLSYPLLIGVPPAPSFVDIPILDPYKS